VANGHTVILDEPDNFVALREIQPWLSAVSDAIDESNGQVLIISHHPELMNQWAPDFGVQFVREGLGPVRVKEFSGKAYSTLVPSEIIARGWENE
jgi:ATPase subunit of ABC transporter with duplicated ATPase domains